MTHRIRHVDPCAVGDDETHAVRPTTFADYVGQRSVVAVIQRAITAVKRRGDSLDHFMFTGPPGLGKTTLAKVIAQELGVEFRETSGGVVDHVGRLGAIVTQMAPRSVLFVDEIHRLPPSVMEALYPVMEDRTFDLRTEATDEILHISVAPFTILAATTRPDVLTAPLRARFGHTFTLDFYDVEDLTKILAGTAFRTGVHLPPDAAVEIARRSRGTPRLANRLLRRCRDHADGGDPPGEVTAAVVVETMETLGIDREGLDDLDRRYLRALRGGVPTGAGTLAAVMGVSRETLDVVEPYLVFRGYVARTPRGRLITSAGYGAVGGKSC